METKAARDVGGGAVPTPNLQDAPLERLAPLPVQKKLEFFGPPRPPLSKEEPFLLFKPLVRNAGTLIAEGRTITLAGVLPVNLDRICINENQTQWPCGIKARTQFRALVRGRAISCLLPNQQQAIVETECTIGKLNLGEWLVEQGWAEAKPGSDLEALGKAAKLMNRGIHGNGR
ncbi:MAG: thermonuclease family protein [Notoacmeibacter sp.]